LALEQTLIASSMAVGFVFGVFDTARKRFSSDGSGVAADFGPAAWCVRRRRESISHEGQR
jgi:uncharacterized protein YdiU (UPF0061 family)